MPVSRPGTGSHEAEKECNHRAARSYSLAADLTMKWPSSLPPRERATLWWQLLAVFVVVTLLNVGFYWQRAFREAAERRNLYSVVRGWDGLAWYVWMPAAPATLLLLRRYPFSSTRPLRSAMPLLAGSAVIYCVVTNTRYLLRILPNVWHPPQQDLPISWPSYLSTQLERTPLDFLTYVGLFAASFAIDYYVKYRQRAEEVLRLKIQAAELGSEIARLQLTALRGQLHPHFLFNSFNAISSLVRQHRTDEAAASLAHLGDLLRSIMETIDLQHRLLRAEVNFIQRYLDIERLRFGERLQTRMEIEEAALEALVPNLLLQPLVENAIKHGISRRVEGGVLRIRIRREGTRLKIEIADNGPGLADGWAESPGIGLRNTRRRLAHVYGADHHLDLSAASAGGTVARLELPWRTTVESVAVATAPA
jgi:two-component sensor histidine kinase